MEPDSAFEREIQQAFCDGRVVGPAGGGADERPQVRAEFLTALLLTSVDGSTGRQALRLRGAAIRGSFDLTGTAVSVPILFRDCRFESCVVLRDASLASLRMPGSSCPELDGKNLTVSRNLELDDGFTAGTVTLLGARVDGDVYLAQAVLRAPEGSEPAVALAASRLVVGGALMAGRIEVHGQIRLISARIASLLSFSGATLDHPDGTVIHAERLEVGESLLLNGRFRANGRVLLRNTTINGGIDATGATLGGGPGGKPCFELLRGTVGRNVALTRATIDGSVGVRSSTVDGAVLLDGVTFPERQSPSDPGACLDATFLRTPRINVRWAVAPTTLDLRHARTEIIEDDPSRWPTHLLLDGCTYSVLEAKEREGEEPVDRLRWLQLGPSHYRPFPYDQLRAAYLASGDEQEARRIGLAKQRRRRQTLKPGGRLLGVVQDWTVGYGYRNWQAALWMVPLVLLGAAAFSTVRPVGKEDAPAFQPIVYAADVLLPIIDLGQAAAYVPQGWGRWVAWTLIVSGWVLATAVVAGLGRLLNRT